MGQSFVTPSQKEDTLGQFDDHIVELFDKLEIDFNIDSLDISTPLKAIETLQKINLMLVNIQDKKKILSCAKASYFSGLTNSESEEMNLCLF